MKKVCLPMGGNRHGHPNRITLLNAVFALVLLQIAAASEEHLFPVDFTNGNAGATSSLGRHGPSKAFELGIKQRDNLPWANSDKDDFPHTVWYKFPQPIRVAKFAFSSRVEAVGKQQSPVQFELVGSDDCESWLVIRYYDTFFERGGEEKSWVIPPGMRRTFRCFGLRMIKVQKGKYVSIKHAKMWTAEKPPTPEHFTLIDFAGGNPGASSQLSRHEAYRAFELEMWKGKTDYTPWANAYSPLFPHTVWYNFSEPVVVGKFGFSSRNTHLHQSPREFELVGSDDCQSWAVIETYKTQFTDKNEPQSWVVDYEAREKYQCYGIRTLRVTKGPYVVVKKAKFWRSTSISVPCK